MSPPDIIDLCSDDSISGTTSTNIFDDARATRLGTSNRASQHVVNRVGLSDIDIELDLEEFLPQRAAKRQRIGPSAKNGSEPTSTKASASLTRGAPVILHRPTVQDALDPISSSQPCDMKATREALHLDDIIDFPQDRPAPRRRSPGLARTTSSLLAEISANTGNRSSGVASAKLASISADVDEGDAPSTTLSKEQFAAIRKEAQIARKAEKEEAKATAAEKKRIERERKAMEKELAANHAEANKGRHDKKISTPEMIVDVHTSMADGHMHTELQKLLKDLSVECAVHTSQTTSVIKWRRKSKTVFNTELQHWELRPEVILDEPQVCCIVTAKEFVEKAASNEIQAYLEEVMKEFPNRSILYLIEGLDSYLKKQRNQKNRAYIAAARQDNSGASSRATQSNIAIDEDAIEDLLVELPLAHHISIFHTINALETAEWLSDLTQHISTVPYKKQRSNLDSQFCMDTGQVKAGDDARDVYVRALQQVVRVTAPIAYGIASEYGDVPSLIRAFRTRGDLALEDIQKHVNRDGTASNARVGPQISRRLAKVFTSLDPDSMDI